MNKYLEKVAAAILDDDIARLDSEYSRLVSKVGAKHTQTGNPFSRDYWRAIGGGGHRMYFEVNEDEHGKAVPKYFLVNATPHILSRALSPKHKILQSKGDTDLLHRIGMIHEAIEADEAHHHIVPLYRDIIEGAPGIKSTPRPVNGHLTPAVLMRESNLISTLKNQAALAKLRAARAKYDDWVLKEVSGKSYGDRFSEGEMVKARPFYDTMVHYEADEK